MKCSICLSERPEKLGSQCLTCKAILVKNKEEIEELKKKVEYNLKIRR